MTGGQPSYTDPKTNLRATRIFFGAMIAGVTLFALVVIGLYKTGGLVPNLPGFDGIVRAIVATVAGICLLIAWTGYRKSSEAAKNLTGSLNDKLNNYRSFLTRYMALCDFPALFSIMAFFLTGDYLLLGVTGILVLAMLLVTPTKNRVSEMLGLDWNEQSQL
jgi:hypothetical protein